MKTTTMTATLTILALAVAATGAAAATDVSRMPGYVSLDTIKPPTGSEVLQEIDLGPELLAAAFKPQDQSSEEAAALAKALEMVKSVRLISFSTEGTAINALRDQVDAIQKKLESQSWQRVIMSRDKHEYVVVSALHGTDTIQGLMVMAVEENEATFINVVGQLNFATLAQLAGQMQSEDVKAALEKLDNDDDNDDEQ